jgi:hypothetical protein
MPPYLQAAGSGCAIFDHCAPRQAMQFFPRAPFFFGAVSRKNFLSPRALNGAAASFTMAVNARVVLSRKGAAMPQAVIDNTGFALYSAQNRKTAFRHTIQSTPGFHGFFCCRPQCLTAPREHAAGPCDDVAKKMSFH